MKVYWLWSPECHVCKKFDENVVDDVRRILESLRGIWWNRVNLMKSDRYYDYNDGELEVQEFGIRDTTEILGLDGVPDDELITPSIILESKFDSEYIPSNDLFPNEDSDIDMLEGSPDYIKDSIIYKVFGFYARNELDLDDYFIAKVMDGRGMEPVEIPEEFSVTDWVRAFNNVRGL